MKLRLHALIWIIAVAFALVTRTIALDRWPGINGDESWYGVNVQELLAGGTPFWRTGIGNPLSPTHSGPLLLLSTLFEPSAAVLRAPEVFLGLLAVLVAYPLLRRPLGDRTALLVTVCLAVAPTTVIYSRFGWDPSGTPLMTLLAIGFALADRPVLSAVSLVFAFWVHPTNLFVVPIVAAAWAPHAIDRYEAASRDARTRLLKLAMAVVVVAIPIAAWLAMQVANNPNTSLPSISMVIERVTTPGLWLSRAWGFVNLFGSVSPVIHVAGPLPSWAAATANTLTIVITTGALAIGWRSFHTHRHGRWLLAGMGVAFIGFHIVAMPFALEPTAERYGLSMFVPFVIVVCMALGAAIERAPRLGGGAATMLVVTMAVLLIGGYFRPLAADGGNAMATFRTSDVEPKMAACAFIKRDSGNQPSRVIAESWWIYWTLRYCAGAGGPMQVEPSENTDLPGGARPAGVAPPAPLAWHRTYVVVFSGSALPATLTQAPPVFTASDPVGRPIVDVFAVEAR